MQTEQVTQSLVESHFKLVLGGDQAIKSAIPGFELAEVHLHPTSLMPVRHEPAATPVADEIGFQPTGQAVFTARADQSVGQQHEGAIGVGDLRLGRPEQFVEQLPQTQLIKKNSDSKDGSPGGRVADVDDMGILVRQSRLAEQQALELREHRGERVFPSKVGDSPLLDLAILTVGFDDADVLVDGAVGGRDFDGTNEHDVEYHDRQNKLQRQLLGKTANNLDMLSLRFSGLSAGLHAKTPQKQAFPVAAGSFRRRSKPNMG